MRSSRIAWMPLVAALLLGACAGGSPRPEARAGPPASTAVAAAPAPDGDARSARSGRIAFDNFHDVWTIDADGTDLTRLTHAPEAEFDPSWSPDGTRIAYRFERNGQQGGGNVVGESDEPEIWVMGADGTGQRRLTAGLSPAWSPDGSLIAFSGRAGLSLIRPDGTGLRVLPHTEGGEYPSWSPDGSRIAFDSNVVRQHTMAIARADGSKVVDLSSVGEGWQVAWSPDGRSILFTSHRDHPDSTTEVYAMRPDGSAVRRLTHAMGYTPAWSPDGGQIVFSAPGLSIMDADGGAVGALPTPGVGETSLADWTG